MTYDINLQQHFSEDSALEFMNRYISEVVKKDFENNSTYPEFFKN